MLQAKRFMHGHYRVLKDLRGFEVTGLQYAFAGSFFSDVNEAGFWVVFVGPFGPNIDLNQNRC